MPIQVHGVLVHAMSGTELSRVRTEFRLRPPEPINKSSLESRGPTLLCNQCHPLSSEQLSVAARWRRFPLECRRHRRSRGPRTTTAVPI